MTDSEHLRVQNQRSRARAVGTYASLTLEQWKQTITDFNGLCAYCLECPFDVLEHFIPIAIAGTTAWNCLPACDKCNYKKSDHTGDTLSELFGEETIIRLYQYLLSRNIASDIVSPMEVKRKARWSTRPYNSQHTFLNLEDQQTYSIQELCDNLTISLLEFAKMSGIAYKSIYHILYGERVRGKTANKLLLTMSRIYDRDLSLRNVTGINVMVNKRLEKKAAKEEEETPKADKQVA